MKRYACCGSVLSLLLFFALPSGAAGFTVPEKLVYNVTWAGIKAGTASLEITNRVDSMKIISTARSVDWMSVFYTVDDKVEATMTKPEPPAFLGMPLNYRIKIREGRHRRDKEVSFDHLRHKAVYRDYLGKEKKEIDIRGKILDPLSSFYYMRRATSEVGKPFFVDVFDNKKIWNVEVQVLRRERIKTDLGDFNTIVIKPLVKSEGLFTRRGDIYIWLTDDTKRIPVKMQTKVRIGHVTATLAGGRY